jgi:hypothetical protein
VELIWHAEELTRSIGQTADALVTKLIPPPKAGSMVFAGTLNVGQKAVILTFGATGMTHQPPSAENVF